MPKTSRDRGEFYPKAKAEREFLALTRDLPCKALWLSEHQVFCQLPSGHTGSHYSRCGHEGDTEVRFELWWDGCGFTTEGEVDYDTVRDVEMRG